MSDIIRYNKEEKEIQINNVEGLKYLETIENNSVNLILTDPPYITSKKTGMDEFAKLVKDVDKQEKLNNKTTKKTKHLNQ
jgi:methylase of polypeptide subunit release factors